MPSRIDEAGHTKAFGYPVAEHWGKAEMFSSAGGTRISMVEQNDGDQDKVGLQHDGFWYRVGIAAWNGPSYFAISRG